MTEASSIREAILQTLTYFDLFDTPLTLEELIEYFYGEVPSSALEIKNAVSTMEELEYEHGLYFLKGRDKLVAVRQKRRAHAATLWRRVDRYRRLFALCPFVKMVAVCNTLSYDNVTATSDIDLFIVTERQHLYTAQFFLKVLTQLFGMRVHHHKIAGRFCLSFFVDERAADLRPLALDFDPHLAYFVKLMVPIAGMATYKEFLQMNDHWTTEYFKHPLQARDYKGKHYPFASALRRAAETMLNLLNVESFFYNSQHKRDLQEEGKKKNPESSIIMTPTIFKLHEHDPRKKIAEKFQRCLIDLKKSLIAVP